MPVKSRGLQVYRGIPREIAIEAIKASNARAAGFRPPARSELETSAKARAAAASTIRKTGMEPGV